MADVTKEPNNSAQTAVHDDVEADVSKDRRSFLQILGATSLPVLAAGCDTDEPEPLIEPGQNYTFREALNDQTFELGINVRKSKRSQPILSESEQMSLDNSQMANFALYDQVRVTRNAENYALYTIGQFRNENNDDRTRMGLRARCRLGTGDTFSAIMSTALTADLTDEEAEAQSEFVERLVDDGMNTGLCVLAPHGGWIELHTHKQAEHVMSLLAPKNPSSWICKGYRQGGGAYSRWHITSTALSPRSFPGLNAIAERGFDYCVAFHGMSADGIVIGGGAPNWLLQLISDAIEGVLVGTGIDVYVATPRDEFAGDSEDNVVNWLTDDGEGGIQIEQSLRARSGYWQQIATAVATVLDPLI